LHDVVEQHGLELFGRHHPRRQFPLLLKFLDCQRTLSVQVHPNDEQAAKLDPPDLGKTEAWVVLAAEPGSKIYAGLKPGVDRQTLERETSRGNCEVCLHEFEPRAGDCVLIEAGTVHALGAGLLIAEIQQASDTTFRLFDWNRVDRDGKPRELHIQQALDTIDFARGPVNPVRPIPTGNSNIERLVRCDKFILDRWPFGPELPSGLSLRVEDTAEGRLRAPHTMATDNRFRIVAVIEGAILLQSAGEDIDLHRGETVLIPASARDINISPQKDAIVLDMYLP
jgi:mannose-6-phosphate isomerase